jgi:pyridoxamine 5'-phosphate oxidase
VNKTSDEESDFYFSERPLESRAAAIASKQSQPIESRPALENRYDVAIASEGGLERPRRWGGYRLMPDQYEFWQGREARLHDRFHYNYAEGEWSILRLQP